jgi:hypothetical protein
VLLRDAVNLCVCVCVRVCVHVTRTHKVVLKALQAAKTTSSLVQLCQQALNYISILWNCSAFSDILGLRVDEISDKLASLLDLNRP